MECTFAWQWPLPLFLPRTIETETLHSRSLGRGRLSRAMCGNRWAHSLPLEMFVHPLESALLVAKSAKHVKCDESAAKKTAELVFACFMCIHGGS